MWESSRPPRPAWLKSTISHGFGTSLGGLINCAQLSCNGDLILCSGVLPEKQAGAETGLRHEALQVGRLALEEVSSVQIRQFPRPVLQIAARKSAAGRCGTCDADLGKVPVPGRFFARTAGFFRAIVVIFMTTYSI
jgi:hypothetical protein